MGVSFIIVSVLLLILSLLPFIRNQHWVFRVPEFIKLQLLVFQFVAIIGLLIFTDRNILFWSVLILQLCSIIYHLFLLARYTEFFKHQNRDVDDLENIKVISANIYQYSEEYGSFLSLIRNEDPDLFVTIESNGDWEYAMRDLENLYPYSQKITLENTYGMHLYAKIPFEEVITHYFVADDVPSIEAHFRTKNGESFVVFCVHPPPPSPTEERTSEERDGDLMCIAKRVRDITKPTIVIGDFNTVAWSNISDLFSKNSGLIDGRHGRGILASYHAKYWFLRAPLDLVFHSTNIFLKELNVLRYIGSDHFPICSIFSIDDKESSQDIETPNLSKLEASETEVLISQGKKKVSENRNEQKK